MTVSLYEAQPAGRHAAAPEGGLLRRVYAPRACDALAYSMATYAMPLVVLASTGSASLTGLAFALEWIPRVAAFGVAGALVDRSGAAIVCFLASLMRAVLVAGAAVALVLVPPGTLATVLVMVLAAVTGALTQFSFIANEAVGAIASRHSDGPTHKVQSVLIGIDQTATLIGPALGGVLLLIGPTWMLACLSLLSFLSAGLALQTPSTPLRGTRQGASRPGGGLREGWQTLRSLPPLRRLVAGLACSNLMLGLLQSASPVLVEHRFGRSPAAAGVLWSVTAAATLVAVACCRAALDRLGLWGVGIISSTVAAAACLAVSEAPSYSGYTALVSLFVAADGGLTIVLRTVRSQVIPPAAFGSTLSLTILLLLLPYPLAGIVLAVTPADHLTDALRACAVLQAVALLVTFLRLRNDPALQRVPQGLEAAGRETGEEVPEGAGR
ncbi:MFS transporter [Streptomyces thermoviolaceus]|uniref:MFS transporter n=1 Tax=Streptomyces thermoviolaceus TaxID=1952 RepID=UPI00203BD24A|nr:MFS transporter [Streptomyces thermoviolaceus]MCM3266150.1 MFS transporter [Streptomyces thermoviolaceus]